MTEIFDIISAINRLKDVVSELCKRIDFICKYPSLIGNVKYVDEKTAAKMLKISKRTLTRLRDERKISYNKVGRRILFPLVDIETYLKNSHHSVN